MREITSLQELKNIELDIMKIIHNFCVENNITYYLAYGTLIGAVRHKGFIPWDDDIDIWMPREDYDKFIRLFPIYSNNNHLKIVNHLTKPYFGRPFSKVIDARTELVEKEFIGSDPIGVFVDIWPLDGIENGEKGEKQLKKVKKERIKLWGAYEKPNKKYSLKKNIFLSVMKIINVRKQVVKVVDLHEKVDYSECDRVMVYCNKHIYNKEWFEQKLLMDFEDTKFYVPTNYDEILKSIYGDYMQLPPEEARKPHHIVDIWWKD